MFSLYVVMLCLSAALAVDDSYPSTTYEGTSTISPGGGSSHLDLILAMMAQMKSDISDLNEKTDTIQQTSQATQALVSALATKVTALEAEVAVNSEKISILEANGSGTNTTPSVDGDQGSSSSIDVSNAPCYRHLMYVTSYTWQDARNWCIDQGGDLAHYGMNVMSRREDVICGIDTMCDGSNDDIWWGIQRGLDGEWRYVNGDLADKDIYWAPGYPTSTTHYNCAYIHVDSNANTHLLTYNTDCANAYDVLCELPC